MEYNPALLVANTILHHCFKHGFAITHMKLQKLIYFVYKHHLKQTGEVLFDEPFLAWKQGPALRSVYDIFKDFAATDINRYLIFGGEKSPRVLSRDNKEFYSAMDYVLKQYQALSGLQLKQLVSFSDTAWAKAIARQDGRLKKVDIWNERWYG